MVEKKCSEGLIHQDISNKKDKNKDHAILIFKSIPGVH
jgi:hypothetical protein